MPILIRGSKLMNDANREIAVWLFISFNMWTISFAFLSVNTVQQLVFSKKWIIDSHSENEAMMLFISFMGNITLAVVIRPLLSHFVLSKYQQ